MNNIMIGFLSILSTVVIYLVAKKIHRKYNKPFTLPVLTGTTVLVMALLMLDISYETYFLGAKFIDHLLRPAIVALAYPLYNNWRILKKYVVPIFAGVLVGGIVGVSSGLLLAKWANFDTYIILSMGPKSVTTPVAMDIALEIGGNSSIAIIFVVVAGIGGGALSQSVLKWAGITHYIGKGVGIGSAAHAIGTSVAMETSEQEGAISAISMTLSAIVVSIIAHPLVWLIM